MYRYNCSIKTYRMHLKTVSLQTTKYISIIPEIQRNYSKAFKKTNYRKHTVFYSKGIDIWNELKLDIY
jgi:hypothetical protein